MWLWMISEEFSIVISVFLSLNDHDMKIEIHNENNQYKGFICAFDREIIYISRYF